MSQILAVFGATVSYVLLNLSHIFLRIREPELERGYRTPGGVATTGLALVLSVVAVVATFFVDERAAGITAGVFVLALTSNPEAPPFQQAVTAAGATVAGSVLDHLRGLNADADGPLGSFGAVVGATIGGTEEDLDVGGPLLVPGLGAQGGTVADVRRIFGPAARLVLASSSREILRAGPDARALADAARAVATDLAALRDAP